MEKGKFMEFNERLRYLIDCEEIKIKDLAPKLCLSASTLSNYTQGIREPDYDTLRRIADYFGVSIDYLLRGTQTVPAVENNISGQLTNSPFIQANHGGVVINGEQSISPEAMELLHIYEQLSGRERLKLLNFAVELEEGTKE